MRLLAWATRWWRRPEGKRERPRIRGPLPEEERQALDAQILALKWYGRSHSGIAKELGITRKRVMRRLKIHGWTLSQQARAQGKRLKWVRAIGRYVMVPVKPRRDA